MQKGRATDEPIGGGSRTLEESLRRFLESAADGSTLDSNPYLMNRNEYLFAFWSRLPDVGVLNGPTVVSVWDEQLQFRRLAYPSLVGQLKGRRIRSIVVHEAKRLESHGIIVHYLGPIQIDTDAGRVETQMPRTVVERHGQFKLAVLSLTRD